MLSVNSSIDKAMSNASHMITCKIIQLAPPPRTAAQCETVLAWRTRKLEDFPCNHMRALLMALSMEEFTDNTVLPGSTSSSGLIQMIEG